MNERLDRANWLRAGLAVLGEAGPAGLKIPTIAKRLGVTKGSFYWHFPSLKSYEAELLAAWEERYTQEVIRHVEAARGSAVDRLRLLLRMAFETDVPLAYAMRQWSGTDRRVTSAQKRVDRKRLAYVATLLAKLGWPRKDAGVLARWTYWAVIGLHSPDTPRPKAGDVEIVLRTLLPETSREV